ncbi:hypothetical protein KJ628_04275 [Patescibacteria group bacterium]|nr:hypothetical protein [Patescibacteria group bacterium]
MIFSFIIIILLLTLFSAPTLSVSHTNKWSQEDTSQEQEIEIEQTIPTYSKNAYNNYLYSKEYDPPQTLDMTLDLDGNNKNEKITVKSYPGFPGDQNTKIYINNSSQPTLNEVGYFHNLTTHQIGKSNHIVQLQLLTGQSINSLFYVYRQEKLTRIPVSTEKSPNYYGIVSRNSPELKDIDGDGTPELLAYYYFFNDPTKVVEVYKFIDSAFLLEQKYEEKYEKES